MKAPDVTESRRQARRAIIRRAAMQTAVARRRALRRLMMFD